MTGASRNRSADVIVVGGGFTGATAAVALARQGVRVTLVDGRATYPTCFKAEKIEPDQVELLQSLDLMDVLRRGAARVHNIHNAHAGRVLAVRPIVQYGIPYPDMVSRMRGALPSSARFVARRVVHVEPGTREQQVRLETGEILTARLVLVAAGASSRLTERLGITRRLLRAGRTVSFAFSVAPRGGGAFPFEALTYETDATDARLAYIALFPTPRGMRANLFTYWEPGETRARLLAHDPVAGLSAVLPRLARATGPLEVTSPVLTGAAQLYAVDGVHPPGVVLMGDACQSTCPATGRGLSNALTEIGLLSREFVPRWLAGGDLTADRIGEFYRHPARQACLEASQQAATYRQRFSVDPSWRFHVHRRRVYLELGLRGLMDKLRRRPAQAVVARELRGRRVA